MKKIFSLILATTLFASLTMTALAASEPSDVKELTAQAQNGAVKLNWSTATDDTGVEGYTVYYGKTPVTKKGENYDSNKDVGDKLEYTVSGLTNGTKYYFSVIAYDAAGNESIAWAPEASATPNGSAAGDKEAPKVANAEALNVEEVSVEFSEEIVLPDEDPQDAFAIENDDTFEALAVLDAKMDEEDETGKTVILTTAAQKKDESYKLTVGIDIKDKAGNPIISGTSDTALFTGSDAEKVDEDASGPKLEKVEVVDNKTILLTFDETIVLSIDPAEDFEIVGKDDSKKKLQVLKVVLGENSKGVEDSTALITTDPQEKIVYTVTVKNVKDETGNEIGGDNTKTFTGIDSDDTPTPDTTAPKDAANFIAEKVLEAQKYIVKLSWDLPSDADWDSIKQQLYLSSDKGGNYKDQAVVEIDKDTYEVSGLEPGEYWLKLTQEDQAGNESAGVVAKVVLAETGPGMIGLVLASLGFGRFYAKRKKKNEVNK